MPANSLVQRPDGARAVLRDVAQYVSADVLTKLIGAISFLYVGKILLPDEFGYYAMALFVVSLGSSLGEWGGASIILRDYHSKGASCLLQAIPVTLVTWSVMSGLVLTLGNWVCQWNPAFAALKEHPYVICVLLLSNPLTTLVVSYLVVSLRARIVCATTIAKSSAQMILLVVLATYLRSYSAQVYALVIADLFGLVIPLFYFRRGVARLGRRLLCVEFWRSLGSQVRAGFVFFSKELISVFQVYLSRIIVAAYLSIPLLGVYSFFLNIMMSLGLLIVSVDRVYTPRMIRLFSESPGRHRFVLAGILPLSALVGVSGYLILVAGGEAGLYHLALRSEYVTQSVMLNGLLFVLVSSALLQMISFSYYIGEKNTSIQKQALINLIFVIVLQFVLVPRLGLRGAVLAEVLASGLRLVSLWLLNRQILGLGADALKLIGLVWLSIGLVSLGLFKPSLAALCGMTMAFGTGVYAYASFNHVREFCRQFSGGWGLVAPSDLTNA